MRLVKLRLVRTPGIRNGFSLEPGPGINLVTGPNGIGKSSVYRAILALLWPSSHGQAPFEASAVFDSDGRRLTVSRRDLAAPVWSGPRPDLGPDHLAVRYELGVLDLLLVPGNSDPLAVEIRKHIAGGFDLDRLRREIFPVQTGRSESVTLKSASGRVVQLQKDQRSLAAEQDLLTGHEDRLDQAGKARDRMTALTTLRDLAEQKAALEESSAFLDGIPEAVGFVRQEDPAKLADLRRREIDHLLEIEKRTAARTLAEKELKELDNSLNHGDEPPIDLLKKKLASLTELGRDLLQAEREAHDPNLAQELDEASRGPSLWPVVVPLSAGIAMIVLGLGFLDRGSVLSWVTTVAGGLAAGAGLLGLFHYFRGRNLAAIALEKKREMAGKQDRLDICRGQWRDALEGINRDLAKTGLEPVTEAEEVAQLIDDLVTNQERARSLRANHQADGDFVDRERGHLEQVRREIQDLFDRLNLEADPQTDDEVSRLLELKPRYDRITRDRDNALRESSRLEKDAAAGAALLREGETTDTPEPILKDLIEKEKVLAADLEPLLKEIARIEAEIENTRSGWALQEAVAAAGTARADLLAVRQTNREAALGRMLLDTVERQHEVESRPLVLQKAAEYFSLFTGHRYDLEMTAQGEGPDRFRAIGEESAAPLELDQLSDGTRAQLLLAVKLAFISGTEDNARPPIFLDDSLTSSDPERFAAAAASLGLLSAREQRQIFYLTPDPTDAAAFQRALAAADLPAAHHIDLAEVRGLAGAADPRLLDPGNLPPNIMAPDPGNLTTSAYAEALHVPRPQPWGPRGNLHIWYLADHDLDLVRRLVDGGAATQNRFGKVKQTLIDAGEITSTEAAQVAARGDLWSAWLDGWRIGRARPVTREFLENSEAVSKTYMEPVTLVMEECGWDGAGLLQAIAAKKVKGFRAHKLDLLRRELAEADLLDPREPLSADELITHTLDQVAPLLATGLLDMKKVRTCALTFARLVEGNEKSASPLSS